MPGEPDEPLADLADLLLHLFHVLQHLLSVAHPRFGDRTLTKM